MAEFKFYCPQCGKQIQCGTSYSGTQINCPVCQQPITVPQAAPTVAQPEAVKPGILRSVLVFIIAVFVLAGLGLGGWYGYSKLNLHTTPPGLVALWSGDGNSNDDMGGSNAQLVNGVGFMPGNAGQAFFLDNGNGGDAGYQNHVGCYVQIAASPALDVGKGDGFTIACWIKPTTVANQMLIAEYERAIATYSGSDVGAQFATDGGRLSANIKDVADQNHQLTSPASLLQPGVWQHVALTYDKASGTAVIYLNGVEIVRSNLGNFTPQTSFAYLLLGGRTTFGSVTHPRSVFSGGMAKIGIFNRALSASEIQEIDSEQK